MMPTMAMTTSVGGCGSGRSSDGDRRHAALQAVGGRPPPEGSACRTLDETLALDRVLLWFRPLIAIAVAMVARADGKLIAVAIAMEIGADGSAPSRLSVAVVPAADCSSNGDGGRR